MAGNMVSCVRINLWYGGARRYLPVEAFHPGDVLVDETL